MFPLGGTLAGDGESAESLLGIKPQESEANSNIDQPLIEQSLQQRDEELETAVPVTRGRQDILRLIQLT